MAIERANGAFLSAPPGENKGERKRTHAGRGAPAIRRAPPPPPPEAPRAHGNDKRI